MPRIKKIKKTVLLNAKRTPVSKKSYIKKVTLEDVVHLYKPEELNALVEISMESEKIQKKMIKKRSMVIRGSIRNIVLGITSKDLVEIARLH
jgi:hypothetical protein